MTGAGGPVFKSRRHRIEQAIARGESTERICDRLGIEPRLVAETRAAMDAALAEDEPDEPLPVAELEFGHGGRVLQPHGTHAAFNRHRSQGTFPCERCWRGERVFQAAKAREYRARNRKKVA